MRVLEKDTDRKAQVNIYVKGQVQALKEYGEYVDPRDNAICCYVPIDEGHQPKVGGRFSGKVTITYINSSEVSDKITDFGRSLRHFCGWDTPQSRLPCG